MHQAWVSPQCHHMLISSRLPIPASSAARRSSLTRPLDRRRRRRRLRPPGTALPCMQAPPPSPEPEFLHLQLVTVPSEHHMLTPGEVRQVALDYFLFHSILQTGSTLFGCVNVADFTTTSPSPARGALLSILSVKNVVPEPASPDGPPLQPRIMVECRCSGRFDVAATAGSGLGGSGGDAPTPWELVYAECTSVHDRACWDIADRRRLAALEWAVWQSCQEVAALMRKLKAGEGRRPAVEQELAVWAPAEYDAGITEDEWAQTPAATRAAWSQRAESFSFGILRCMESDERSMREARETTSTMGRLELAMECVEKKRALTSAQLSLKNVWN